MTFKMQADVNLLQAHYEELERRLAELEERVDIVNRGISTIVGGGDHNKLRLVIEDKLPVPRKRKK